MTVTGGYDASRSPTASFRRGATGGAPGLHATATKLLVSRVSDAVDRSSIELIQQQKSRARLRR